MARFIHKKDAYRKGMERFHFDGALMELEGDVSDLETRLAPIFNENVNTAKEAYVSANDILYSLVQELREKVMKSKRQWKWSDRKIPWRKSSSPHGYDDYILIQQDGSVVEFYDDGRSLEIDEKTTRYSFEDLSLPAYSDMQDLALAIDCVFGVCKKFRFKLTGKYIPDFGVKK